MYQFGLAYRAKPRASLFYERKDPASSFEVQYDHFKKIFRKKTGINWDARLVTPFVDGEVNFCYTPPVSQFAPWSLFAMLCFISGTDMT